MIQVVCLLGKPADALPARWPVKEKTPPLAWPRMS